MQAMDQSQGLGVWTCCATAVGLAVASALVRGRSDLRPARGPAGLPSGRYGGLGLYLFGLALGVAAAAVWSLPTPRASAAFGLNVLGLLGVAGAGLIAALAVRRDRRARRALAESEAAYRILSDGVDQLVWAAGPEGVTDANRHWFEYTGLTPAQTVGDGWIAALHPDDAAAARSCWESAVSSGGGFDVDYRFRRGSDGSYRRHVGRVRPVLEGGPGVTRWVGTAVDAEDRGRSVETLRADEERLRLALDAGRMGTWDYDVGAETVACSPSLEAIHGRLPGTFPGTFEAYQGDIHPDDREGFVRAVRRAVASALPHYAEYRLVWPDGSVHWVEDRGKPFVDASGRVERVTGVCVDVTERKRVEGDLRRALALAEDAGRAKDKFLAMLSHELRTPLAPVLLAAEEMLADPDVLEHHRESLALVRQNVELEVRLIDDLLDVTRVVHGKLQYRFEVVDAHSLLRRTVDVCRGDVDAKRIDLVLDTVAAEHHVLADPARLQQVLWNLVKNAVKFTPAGGLVRVRTWDEGTPSRLTVEVSDTGLGIDPAVLPRIFNAFEQAEDTADGRFGGLGLGLAISRAIVTAHGGELTAESRGRNQGATFRVSLPTAAPADGAGPDGVGRPHADAPARPLRILLVEDDPMTARIMARLLRNNGYEVTTANTLAAARAVSTDGVDLLVSDLGLPDGSGLDLMRSLAPRGVPGIALTGFGMEEDVRNCRDAGFIAHLTKPVDFARLDAMIRKVASEHPRGVAAPVAET